MDPQVSQALVPLQRLREVIERSGLVPDERIATAFDGWSGDLKSLERRFVDDDSLTAFQFSELCEGRAASLRVGNYDILDRLGAGGMGTVFKARHRRMKRIVALKVLATKFSANPVFVKRFQREVETIACLGHPNVVMAYDADESEIGHFLVMEFVAGVDLYVAVKRDGRFGAVRAINCVRQAARGLAYAHGQGIIHRDVKPHNLLQDGNGFIKVTDLGLARLNHGADGPSDGMEVTMAGGVIGTPEYMSPEQSLDSTTVDHRADIYSLGCTLYFLLAGNAPFSGASFMAVLLKHRDGEIPSLSTISPGAPPRLEELFRRMLAKDPNDRIQSMAEVADELEAIEASLGPYDAAAISTSATLEMPAVSASAETDGTADLSDLTIANVRNASPITVLIVEPSRVQASFIKNHLEERSHSVVATVASCEAAVTAFRELRPRAVVSAMYLPDADGASLARRIASECEGVAPGFLLITSESDDEAGASLTGGNDVRLLRKPFTAVQMDEALRQVAPPTPGQRPRPTIAAANRPASISRSEVRVLIVDDSGAARLHERSVLQSLGFAQFVDAQDGAHAIAMASREAFDLIVTDYNMPLMDGRALISYLKQNASTSATPIIMVTSETDPGALGAIRELGVVAILDKSFRPDQVGPLVNSLF